MKRKSGDKKKDKSKNKRNKSIGKKKYKLNHKIKSKSGDKNGKINIPNRNQLDSIRQSQKNQNRNKERFVGGLDLKHLLHNLTKEFNKTHQLYLNGTHLNCNSLNESSDFISNAIIDTLTKTPKYRTDNNTINDIPEVDSDNTTMNEDLIIIKLSGKGKLGGKQEMGKHTTLTGKEESGRGTDKSGITDLNKIIEMIKEEGNRETEGRHTHMESEKKDK